MAAPSTQTRLKAISQPFISMTDIVMVQTEDRRRAA
jgi:hypothetical protein